MYGTDQTAPPKALIIDRLPIEPGLTVVVARCPFGCRRGWHAHVWHLGQVDGTRPSHCLPFRLYELVA